MLNERCRTFREGFMPGLADGHGGECPVCRQWAQDVKSLRAFGANLPLPGELRSRLEQMPASRGQQDPGSALGRLPQVPVPSNLVAKLYRIPTESKLVRARRPIAARSGEMIAASFFFAVLLTLGLGNSLSQEDHPNLSTASRIAGTVLKEAGNRGTQTLLGVGESIFDGCIQANRSLEELLGRIGGPRRDSTPEPRAPKAGVENPPQPPSTQGKENPHGSSQTH